MSNPNAPHKGANFEGFFTKFDLDSGATLIIVMCCIAHVSDSRRRNNVTVTYRHPTGASWQRVLTPATALSRTLDGKGKHQGHEDAWNLSFWDAEGALVAAMGTDFSELSESLNMSSVWPVVAESGRLRNGHVGTMFFVNDCSSSSKPLRLAAYTGSRTPWTQGSPTSSPEGLLGLLPLPLHWHVHSLRSHATLVVSPGFDGVESSQGEMKDEDVEMQEAKAHEEKNWANGFPSAHMWVQARHDDDETEGLRSVCLAGGRIMGVDAYLVGYRNDARQIRVDFRPPLAMSALGLSPFMSIYRDWSARRFKLDVSSWRHRLQVEAHAAPDSFFHFAAPQPQGFMPDAMAQSADATINVKLWRRALPGLPWRLAAHDSFGRGSLEFGGDYYPERPG